MFQIGDIVKHKLTGVKAIVLKVLMDNVGGSFKADQIYYWVELEERVDGRAVKDLFLSELIEEVE